jgi:hypothetical protein
VSSFDLERSPLRDADNPGATQMFDISDRIFNGDNDQDDDEVFVPGVKVSNRRGVQTPKSRDPHSQTLASLLCAVDKPAVLNPVATQAVLVATILNGDYSSTLWKGRDGRPTERRQRSR